ncbi:MAG: putative manganese-dependent inorganic diphosphatase [Firmicutes bacterium]|nr:putative manganese-dependent inorganic diphosphatase [Bacillota bacterium]
MPEGGLRAGASGVQDAAVAKGDPSRSECPVYVVGHRNPDTDSVCAALGYAALKNALQEAGPRGGQAAAPDRTAPAMPQPEVPAPRRRYIAAVLGDLNPETTFVLGYFSVEPPQRLEDVWLRVADVMDPSAPSVGPHTPLLAVGRMIQENPDVKAVPVVDEHRRLLGVCTAGDIARRYLEIPGPPGREGAEKRPWPLRLDNLQTALDGRFLVPAAVPEARGRVLIGAMSPETMRSRLGPGDVVLLGDREEAQKVAIQAGVAALVITGGLPVSPPVLEQARQNGVAVLSCPYDTYTAARLVNLSLPVAHSMTRNVVTCSPEERLADVLDRVARSKHRSFPVVDEDGALVGMLSRAQLMSRRGKQVILVDHNERSQAVAGLEEAEILEVLDHHRLGDIQTGAPIFMRCEPVGSTCTLVGTLWREAGLTPPPALAGALMGAILSDTLVFRSPTCTPLDRQVAAWLGQIAGQDPQEFGRRMFAAQAESAASRLEQALTADLKLFSAHGRTLAISQIQVMDSSAFRQRRAELLAALEDQRRRRTVSLWVVMLTDLLQEASYLYAAGEPRALVEEAFGRPWSDGEMYLPGVLSRKQQVVPPLLRALERMGAGPPAREG